MATVSLVPVCAYASQRATSFMHYRREAQQCPIPSSTCCCTMDRRSRSAAPARGNSRARSRARSAAPARGNSRGRSRARSAVPSRKRARSFEELFSFSKKLSNQRKLYPKRQVDDLVRWLGHAKTLADAGRALKDIQAAQANPEEVLTKRKALLDERESILQCADIPANVTTSIAKLVDYLGGPGMLGVVDDADFGAAEEQHAAWFTALTEATRHSTAMAHALQTQLADNSKFMGPDSAAATSLTVQWAVTEQALEAEEKLLADRSPVARVCECVSKALEVAGELEQFLSRGKDDYGDIVALGAMLKHVRVFPELSADASFRRHLANLSGLPMLDQPLAIPDEEAWASAEVSEDNAGDYAKLALHAHKLATGNAIPIFELDGGKLMAHYRASMNLHAFCSLYEVDSLFLARVFSCVSASLAQFQQVMGRCHGNVGAANVFVDESTMNIVLGPPRKDWVGGSEGPPGDQKNAGHAGQRARSAIP